MNRINLLDCTLRDGGYINNFCFGYAVMENILQKLSKASIDIIECGFLKSGAFDRSRSLFGSVEAVKNVIGNKNPNLMYVGMIQYGAISNDEISIYDGGSIDGIRVTFHEHEIEPAFVLAKQLMGKGYKVFMQPVGTMTYTDDALLKLIRKINKLKPFAFYLVDTLGTMYKNDLLRMFYLVDHNLNKNITIGFHSHNNLQLSFANAQEIMQLNTPRRLIIDASVYGMGRGAGNLNTELVTHYINTNFGLKYDNLEILEIIDEYIRPLSLQYKWGYDAAFYIASVTGCHPNYASFLINKQTLHVPDMYAILSNLDVEKRILFDKQYIGEEYIQYMNHHVDDAEAVRKVASQIGHKRVLLLAPGKSLRTNEKRISKLAQEQDLYVISVNFIPVNIKVNASFISNMKRFKGVHDLAAYSRKDGYIVIVTSNIATKSEDDLFVVDYSSYINEEQCIADNAGLMCINLLKKVGVQEVILAGFDGFSTDLKQNFYEQSMMLDVETERLAQINDATARKLTQLKKQIKISFTTESAYITEDQYDKEIRTNYI